jgi:hypothetical protein
MEYAFPVMDKFQARTVLEEAFEIDPSNKKLYVNLDKVRGRDYLDRLFFCLNIEKGKYCGNDNRGTKILFSGHQGTGKTMELKRLHNIINVDGLYYSVLIEIEKEFELAYFSPEDIFLVLLTNLVESLSNNKINFMSNELSSIIKSWTNEKEIIDELIDEYKINIKSETNSAISFFGFLKMKAALKGLFSKDSKTTSIIRNKINKDHMSFINTLNKILQDLEIYLRSKFNRCAIVFIFDGSEKIDYASYKKLFVDSSYMLKSLKTNIVFSVPINSYFDISGRVHTDFFNTYTLPMVPVNEKSVPFLKEIIIKRISGDIFFDSDVLPRIVSMSGGCIRQLLKMVHRSILISTGDKVTMKIANESIFEIGMELYDKLDSKHIKALKRGKWHKGDGRVKELLLSLALLNHKPDLVINPLLMDLLNE